MSDEHDSWIHSALGLDLGGALQKVEDAGSAVAGGAAKALEVGNDAGKALMNVESASWDKTKGAYTAVTGAYDSVAPNFTKANKDVGQLVDAGEAAVKKGNDQAVAEYGDVPVVGSLVKASAWLSNTTTEATGGVVKGVGDLAAMGGNAIFHPIDAAASLGEGALGIAEHVPTVPGLNTTVKGIHGLVDLARGKTDGEYGGSLSELGENLLLNTHKDPDDPSKKSNSDVDFFAGIGGGKKAWSEKPAEAATRTITNLVPMFLGDEAAGGKPPPEVPPEFVEPVPDTVRNPQTQRGLGEPQAPDTLRDPQTQRGLGDPQAPDTLRDPQTQRGLGDPPAPDTLRDPQTQRGLGDPPAPDTLRDPQTQRGLGDPEAPDTLRDPQTQRGLGDPGLPEPVPDAPASPSGTPTPVPQGDPIQPLELRPTEFPKGPAFNPTVQPPGIPAPDFAPGEVNPFEDPLNPRIPRPPRLPTPLEDGPPTVRDPAVQPGPDTADTVRNPGVPEPFPEAPSFRPPPEPVPEE